MMAVRATCPLNCLDFPRVRLSAHWNGVRIRSFVIVKDLKSHSPNA